MTEVTGADAGEGTAVDGETSLGDWQDRLDRALGPIGYAALLVSLALALLIPSPAARPPAVILPAAAAALVCLLLRTALDRRPAAAERPLYCVPLFAALLALITLLVLCDPWFGFFAFSGYLQAARHLRGFVRVLGVAAPAVPSSLSQIGGVLPTTGRQIASFLTILAFNLLVVGVIITLSEVTDRLSRRRQQANAELAEANAKLTATLAENAGLHAQLLVQAREAGVADERRRMAREMHDTVAQGLAGIVTQLQAADQAREQREPAEVWHRHLDSAARLARESLDQARRAVHALRPEELERAGLPDALAEVLTQWQERHTRDGAPAAALTVTGDARPLHPEVEVTLLRTAQESLANVAKHAAASRVGLTLSYMTDLVTLDVRDDGVGFDPDREPESRGTGGGYGLSVMRQRVQRLSGRLEIETEPGVGTTVSAAVPAIGRGA
ncbi:sensor histidine kinase [Kitasatospora kazusensis]|uniref:sensor histidine kinase n=1 Tax=Kitasatospora kazusensis TaxID=407974 RepID=UPI0031D7DC48